MLYGEELLKSIQKRCRIQPGMLVKSNHDVLGDLLALVVEVSPGCSFDRDYEGAEEHIFYRVQEKYDLSYKIDQDRLPERVKIYPACVQFNELEDIMGCENNTIMLFPNEAEVLS